MDRGREGGVREEGGKYEGEREGKEARKGEGGIE